MAAPNEISGIFVGSVIHGDGLGRFKFVGVMWWMHRAAGRTSFECIWSPGIFYWSLLYTMESWRLVGCIIRANRPAAFAALRSLTGEWMSVKSMAAFTRRRSLCLVIRCGGPVVFSGLGDTRFVMADRNRWSLHCQPGCLHGNVNWVSPADRTGDLMEPAASPHPRLPPSAPSSPAWRCAIWGSCTFSGYLFSPLGC